MNLSGEVEGQVREGVAMGLGSRSGAVGGGGVGKVKGGQGYKGDVRLRLRAWSRSTGLSKVPLVELLKISVGSESKFTLMLVH